MLIFIEEKSMHRTQNKWWSLKNDRKSQLSENTHYWMLLCYFSWVLIETKNTQISIDLKKNLLVYSRSVYENLFLFFIKIDVL